MTNTGKQQEQRDDDSAAKPHARAQPTPKNPRGYPPFNMSFVPSYTNNQITYYYTTGAIPAADQARFQELMEQRVTGEARAFSAR